MLESLTEWVDGLMEFIVGDTDSRFRGAVNHDLNVLESQSVVPPTPDCFVGVSDVADRVVQHAFIGSRATANLSGLQAAEILRARKIHSDFRFFVTQEAALSANMLEVMAAAGSEGQLCLIVEAGAMIARRGCGPCADGGIGGIGGMGNGETSINTGTRNDCGLLEHPKRRSISAAGRPPSLRQRSARSPTPENFRIDCRRDRQTGDDHELGVQREAPEIR